jgi:predicted DNA-binding protein YlxM (UPF0122 family)
MLYDFYGSLLTDKQREILELYYQHDLSLAEIAADSGISRQGVHDLVKRAVRTLEKAEERMGLVKRFAAKEKLLRRIREIISAEKMDETARLEVLRLLDSLPD